MIKHLKSLEAKATPGTWEVIDGRGLLFVAAKPYDGHPYKGVSSTIEIMSDEDYPTKHEDATLIAALRNAAPALIACVEAAQAASNDLADVLSGIEPNDLGAISALIEALGRLEKP